MNDWFRPARSSGDDRWDVRIRPGDPGWSHTGLYAVTLAAGESRAIDTGDCEFIVLPLSGPAVVEVAGQHLELAGRAHVFAGPTDLVYVPRDTRMTITAPEGGRLAIPFARARAAYPVRRVAAAEVPVELRGAGASTRQVHNFGTPAVLAADSLIACEVITPAGNWSSYPPHKHDEDRDGVETALEEIYYFEFRVAPEASRGREPAGPSGGFLRGQPLGYLRNYGTDERTIDTLEEVHSGDVVLVPYGWHGPAMAPPGYDMYYLNIMAGPGDQRAWLICDDPGHAWVRDTWAGQEQDPRLPLSGSERD
ncbi:MAG: 5-deoxy-glucuronate isomerase [Actinomycetales bacterium]|nr:5-deoxy-glucuronate isomerase [Actinomycetales bacterium]